MHVWLKSYITFRRRGKIKFFSLPKTLNIFMDKENWSQLTAKRLWYGRSAKSAQLEQNEDDVKVVAGRTHPQAPIEKLMTHKICAGEVCCNGINGITSSHTNEIIQSESLVCWAKRNVQVITFIVHEWFHRSPHSHHLFSDGNCSFVPFVRSSCVRVLLRVFFLRFFSSVVAHSRLSYLFV